MSVLSILVGWTLAWSASAGEGSPTSEAEQVAETRRHLERRAAETLAAGGDATALLERAHELPRTAVRRAPEQSFAQRLERAWAESASFSVEKPALEKETPGTGDLEAAPNPFAELDALVQARFDEVEAMVRRAGTAVHLERLEQARRAYASRLDGLKNEALRAAERGEKSTLTPLVTETPPAVLLALAL